jgi:hypothetical protein
MDKRSVVTQDSQMSYQWFAIGFLGFLVIQLLMVVPAQAKDCVLDRKFYPPGTIKGPYVCAPNGTWQPKK